MGNYNFDIKIFYIGREEEFFFNNQKKRWCMSNKYWFYLCLALIFILLINVISVNLKPLTPEQQAERQKAHMMEIFENAVFFKDPTTGECIEAFFKKNTGETEPINDLVTVLKCNCDKVPPEILITAESLKTP